jgi:uncharacterized protein (DUF1697 family)
MADLRELLDGQGYKDVRTHLQSGNVVLSSTLSPRQLERTLERQLAEGFGFDISVLVRTRAELAKVVERNPLRKVATDGSRHVVSFLSRRLPAAAARELEAADVAPERVAISGREIYAWYPNGIQGSPLGKLLDDSHLGVVSTARNWNTVVKLLELASE